jgi:hypothetical protein
MRVHDAKTNDDKQEVADETIEKILPNLEMNKIQMQQPLSDFDKHIHESDAKTNDDKQEVTDENIEKILPNPEMNEIQMQDWQCVICKKEFTDKRKLTEHVQAVHRGQKPFKCDICGYTAAIKHNLARHVEKVHKGKKTFKPNQRSEDKKSQVNEFYFQKIFYGKVSR